MKTPELKKKIWIESKLKVTFYVLYYVCTGLPSSKLSTWNHSKARNVGEFGIFLTIKNFFMCVGFNLGNNFHLVRIRDI